MREGAPLYERLLGGDFERLPPVLKSLHRGETARATGELEVQRGRGLLHWFVGVTGGLPPAGEARRVDLEVECRGDRERWVRTFDGETVLPSDQWDEAGLFAEAAGPLVFLFRLEATHDAMIWHFERATMGPLTLPRWLSPEGFARATAVDDTSWRVDVGFSVPLLGQVLRYRGVMTLLPSR